MSKPVNKTLIGTFVLGAVGLLVASVMIFGSGKFFSHTYKYVTYFKGSVKGLQVGSPVMFRGVKIGQVSAIELNMDIQDLSVLIPVVVDIDPKTITVIGGQLGTEYSHLEGLINKGLKAQLQTSSIVTGQLMVYVDFFPDVPIKLIGPPNGEYPEIPSMPTDMQELARRFEELPLKEILGKFNNTLSGIDHIVNSPSVEGSLVSANQLMKDLDRLVAQNENLGYQTNKTLEEVARLSRSLNSFVGYLSRHPEALLRGKKQSQGD